MQKEQKGFTLVELLVVIAIIAILAGAILVTINPLRIMKESRDAQRLSDMDTVNKALSYALADEEIKLIDDAGSSSVPVGANTSKVDGTGWVKFTVSGTTGLAKYLAALPLDPTNDPTYHYTFASKADDTYELNAVLESAKYKTRMENDGGDNTAVYEIGSNPGLSLLH